MSASSALLVCWAFQDGTACAQPTDPSPPAVAPADPSSRIVAPDLVRGLEEPRGVEAEDVALALPRAIFAVPNAFIGVLFTPLREGLRYVEKHHVIERVEDFLYLNDEHTAAILPVITLSTFFGAQIGVQAFHDNLGGHGESARIKASWGADREQQYVVSFKADQVGGTPLWVESITTFEDHPSIRFYGIGGDASREELVRRADPREVSVRTLYAEQRFRQLLTVGATFGEPGKEGQVGARGRFKAYEFSEPRGFKPDVDRRLEDVYETSKVVGYDDEPLVSELEAVANVVLRDPTGKSGHAFVGEAYGGGALPFRDYRYAQFGASVTGFIDLFHGNRLLVLRAVYQAVAGPSENIPFVELPSLGGPHRLRGYPQHRFLDEKAFVATVEYQYPVHEYLAGTLFFDAGEVSENFDGLFDNPNFHFGGGGGLIVRKKEKVYLSAEIAGGEGVQVVLTTDPLRAFADRDDLL
ncbi:MAG: BamA/TamA family outer membrane protein [Myxococcales bacterium]|nr:BamA/TamA family outer membrane protein [Myxococcales bacterium]